MPPGDAQTTSYLGARFLFLRALGLIFLSAFVSLAFEIDGLIGPDGLEPAGELLRSLRPDGLVQGVLAVPSLLWLGASSTALHALVALGVFGSVLLVLNVAPRAALVVCGACFLSFVSAAGDFSSYQSDGMLLEAAFLGFFLAPRGLRPGLAPNQPVSRAARLLLLWEWARIYWESGLVKLLSGDPQWRALTAMDQYYENCPFPTALGWYAQHLPHGFHAASAFLTLALELFGVWFVLLGRKGRLASAGVTTLFQLGIIATANYAFLNHIVVALGLLLVDDAVLRRIRPLALPKLSGEPSPVPTWRRIGAGLALGFQALASSVLLVGMTPVGGVLPRAVFAPAFLAEPFRIANRYGLFAVMTRERLEIEFQGSNDGRTWTPYPFRFKPQDLNVAPKFYAPLQARFDWNLWFASLSDWSENPWVLRTEVALLEGDRAVASLFAANPFPTPPKAVRTVLWKYTFTSLEEHRADGRWWSRVERGPFAPAVRLDERGRPVRLEP